MNYYVLYDLKNDYPLQDRDNGSVILFEDKKEADDFQFGFEIAIPWINLPKHWQEIIIKQLKN